MKTQQLEGVKPVEIAENQQIYFVNGQSYGVIDRKVHNLTNDTHHRKVTINISSDNRENQDVSPIGYGVVALTEQNQVVANINASLADPTKIAQIVADCMQIITQTLKAE